jgi:hypothetical protein
LFQVLYVSDGQGDHLPARRRQFTFVSGFVCLRRARGLTPLASPVAPGADRSAVPFRAFRAASPVRRKAVQRAAGVSVETVMHVLRVQGDDLPARRRLFLFRGIMSPTGKVTDSPCIPRCAPDGVVRCALAGVRGGVSGSKQGSTTRRRRICGNCDARTEGAGR